MELVRSSSPDTLARVLDVIFYYETRYEGGRSPREYSQIKTDQILVLGLLHRVNGGFSIYARWAIKTIFCQCDEAKLMAVEVPVG